MHKILSIILLSVCYSITVDGYVYLENQTEHSDIKIIFERVLPSSLIDTVVTNNYGYYNINIESGIFNISFLYNLYFTQYLHNEIIVNATTLDTLTLSTNPLVISIPKDYAKIQDALNIAGDGTIINVSIGTYYENLIWPDRNGISLIGSKMEDCIINGSFAGNVIKFLHHVDSTTLISGFTIENGLSQSDGGGLFLSSHSSPTLQNLLILNNQALENGGGLYCHGLSDPHLENITFNLNKAENGGGMCFGHGWVYSPSKPQLYNVNITNNTASHDGGGIYTHEADPIIENCFIVGNSAYSGGGLSIYDHSFAILNNVHIMNNQAYKGGGIEITHFSVAELNNVIISSNYAGKGSAIYIDQASPSNFINVTIDNHHGSLGTVYIGEHYSVSPNFINTIFSNNDQTIIYLDNDQSGSPTFKYCNFYNRFIDIEGTIKYSQIFNINFDEWLFTNITTNTNGDSIDVYNNVSENPKYCNSTLNNFNLAESSPLIGAGKDGSNIGALDIGCTEYIINGCMNSEACNYNSDATEDDGSCIYAPENYDCQWNCIYDTDSDGICDEEEILGCTEENACNYYDDATDNDGSCIYAPENYDCQWNCIIEIDCAGVCGGNSILDECGICGGDNACLSINKIIIPDHYSISNIYPNPFNSATNIAYGLPKHVNVQIMVHNLSGKQIETLINQFQTPGYHSVTWNADNYPSGVYLIRVESGDFTQIQKVALVK